MKGSSSALVILCTIMFTRQCMAVQWFSSIEEYFRWQARRFGLQASITTEPSSRTDSQIMTDASWLFNDDQPSTDVETTTSNVATTTEYMEMLPECCMMGKRAGRHGFSCVVDDFSFLSKDRERNRGHNFKYINPYRNIQSQAYNRCLTSGVRALTLEFQRCCKHAYRMRERPSSHLNGLLIEPPIQSEPNRPQSRYRPGRKHH